MKTRLQYIFFSIVLGSCELAIDVGDRDFSPSLVVNGLLTPDSTIGVLVMRDSYILEQTTWAPPLDADVQLFEGGELIGNLIPSNTTPFDGYYSIDHTPVSGTEYTIEVTKTGFPTVTARETIPARDFEFSITELSPDPEDFNSYRLAVEITDPPGQDFYELALWITFTQIYFEEDTLVIGERFTERIGFYTESLVFEEYVSSDQFIFPDDIFDGGKFEIIVNFSDYYGVYLDPELEDIEIPENEYSLELRSTSESYYRYYNSTALQNWTSGDPFAQPVQVYSNAENGFGILAGYMSRRKDITLPQTE